MSSRRSGLLLAFAVVLAAASSGRLQGQGFYYRTVQKNPLTGRQEIVDLQRPRWTGQGKGGFMFEPAIGSMQVAAVGRSRFTGRLEYYNHYLNPWTGAQHATATRFNPYSGRYETLHQIEPAAKKDAKTEPANPVVAAAPTEKPKRRVRVIESKLDANAPPPAVVPGATSPELVPGGVLPPQEPASSKTIEWKEDNSSSTLEFKINPKDDL